MLSPSHGIKSFKFISILPRRIYIPFFTNKNVEYVWIRVYQLFSWTKNYVPKPKVGTLQLNFHRHLVVKLQCVSKYNRHENIILKKKTSVYLQTKTNFFRSEFRKLPPRLFPDPEDSWPNVRVVQKLSSLLKLSQVCFFAQICLCSLQSKSRPSSTFFTTFFIFLWFEGFSCLCNILCRCAHDGENI